MYGEICFKPLCKFASGEHDTPPAASTFQPNIRAETRDGPFIGAARMLFAQAQVIVESQVGKHVGFLSAVSIINES